MQRGLSTSVIDDSAPVVGESTPVVDDSAPVVGESAVKSDNDIAVMFDDIESVLSKAVFGEMKLYNMGCMFDLYIQRNRPGAKVNILLWGWLA